MGKADFYRHGDWNAICDRCGFKYKASQLHRDWTGLMVCKECVEDQHPQDFVRGKIDRQRVPWARPDKALEFTTTTLNGAVIKGATSIIVASATGIVQYSNIGIETNQIVQDASGITGDNVTAAARYVHTCYVASIAATTITLTEQLPYAAASGRTVYINSDSNFLSETEVTVASLG